MSFIKQVSKNIGGGIEEQVIIPSDSDFGAQHVEWSYTNASQEPVNIYNDAFEGTSIGQIVKAPSNEYMALSRLYDYRGKNGEDFTSVVMANSEELVMIAEKMFPNISPLTMEPDIDANAFYTPYIPLVVANNTMIVQKKDGKSYFNPRGTVSIAELLDGFVAIRYGANHNGNRSISLDNNSDENDYFNEGYNECVDSYSALFSGLYTRRELMRPVTRLELAYITVLCWRRFREYFDTLYGGAFAIGISFDWEDSSSIVANYEDGLDYKVSVMKDKANGYRLSLKDYKGDRTVTEYLTDLKEGSRALPFPMFMSLLELGVLEFFHFEDNRLDPLKEVSRGEFCYFLNKIASIFKLKYLS